jgi:hypothetical protein
MAESEEDKLAAAKADAVALRGDFAKLSARRAELENALGIANPSLSAQLAAIETENASLRTASARQAEEVARLEEMQRARLEASEQAGTS